jgi:FkbM family methyltransferase
LIGIETIVKAADGRGISVTFISYAQNFEDVVLWRALHDVGQGCYIDVGAAHPTAESVTKAFYDAGWSGINIEPGIESHRLLVEERPRDINLQIALGESEGTTNFFRVGRGNGLSTTDDLVASGHERNGWNVERVPMKLSTLASVCASYAIETVHFLKIDVEGSELAVLQGADFTKFRPWILLIESIAPQSLLDPQTGEAVLGASLPAATHDQWESLVIEAGYSFALFDGLNRFYVADEKAEELQSRLSAPANCLDSFKTASEVAATDFVDGQLSDLRGVYEVSLAEITALQNENTRLVEVSLAEITDLQNENTRLVEVSLAEITALQNENTRLFETGEAVALERDDALQSLFVSTRSVARFSSELQRVSDELRRSSDDRESIQAAFEEQAVMMQSKTDQLQADLREITSTIAWRITKPLRLVRRIFRRSR